MVWAAFRSEWTKLRRPSLLVSTIAGLAAAASLFVVLLFAQAHARGGSPSLATLARPNGLVQGVDRVAVLLGIVAFGIAAAQIAGEYGLGTLRQLLVRQPRRLVLLAGKLLGIVSFLVLALVVAAVAAMVVALIAAHARHVPTAAWFTSTGIGDLVRELGDLTLAVVGFSVLGFAVGLFLRSSVSAVIVGFAWLLPIEAVIIRIVPGTLGWLPGSALQIVAEGGTAGFGYGKAIAVATAYAAVAVVATAVAFTRRDVTA
jgi:ABC-2 type transport system permease protein